MALKRRRKRRPYWLEGDDEICAVCEAPHAAAVSVRCVACDRPACVLCVAVVRREAHCVACRKE